jgi:hypothetical protein
MDCRDKPGNDDGEGCSYAPLLKHNRPSPGVLLI